jgi:hypothetical protein
MEGKHKLSYMYVCIHIYMRMNTRTCVRVYTSRNPILLSGVPEGCGAQHSRRASMHTMRQLRTYQS